VKRGSQKFCQFCMPCISSSCQCQFYNKKSELILIRRAVRPYGSSCLQLISVYLHPFCCISLFCSQKSHKITKILCFLGSRSCKVINVDTINKHVTIACYDNIAKFRQKKHVIQRHLTLGCR